MVITAVIDRIENGQAILLSDEIGLEISIPIEEVEGAFKEGEVISLTISENGCISLYE